MLIPRRCRTSLVPVFCLLFGIAQAADRPRAGQPATAGRAVENQSEGDWVDNRWSQTDIGQFLASNIEVGGTRIAKALTVKVGDGGEGAVCFDTGNCAWRAAWLGGFLRPDPARFGLIHAPRPAGNPLFPVCRGEAALEGNSDAPAAALWRGLHRHGRRVVLDYMLSGRRILESPWLETNRGLTIFTRTLQLAPSSNALRLAVANIATMTTEITNRAGGSRAVARSASGDRTVVVAVGDGQTTLERDGNRLLLRCPAQATELRVKLLLWAGPSPSLPPFAKLEQASSAAEDLTPWLEPGPSRWLPELKTAGQRGLDTDVLAIDTLTVPYENPWRALFFLAGVDFGPDGSAFVCTIHGDVWRVSGIDARLRELRWRRFATGLFQPLGLKVRNGQVFVLGRDQITRLHDQDGDGEADFYENFCNQIQTAAGHEYVTSLEQDDAGRFYYVDPRGVHRVSADGQQLETLATGWRNPNGLGVTPDGRILTVAPQQGEWTPSSQISEVKPGGYYGYGGPKKTPERPLGYDAPLCWIPHAVDNSSGSQVWLPQGQWGPFGGHFLHLLWGRCGMMLLLRDVVDQVPQGAVVPLAGRLLAGPNRGTFNPRDGHVYLAGSTGWQTSAAKDGALQRVRYTGKPALLPVGWHAHSNGLTLTFSQPLTRATAEDPGSYAVRQWNYRYAASYGSKDWSVADPDREGRDDVDVRAAALSSDGRTVFLEMPGLRPVMQMEIRYNLSAAGGGSHRSQLWLTLNRLDRAREPGPN